MKMFPTIYTKSSTNVLEKGTKDYLDTLIYN